MLLMTTKAKVTDLGCVGVAIGATDHGRLCCRAGLALDQIRRSDPVFVGHVLLLWPTDEKREELTNAPVPTASPPGTWTKVT